MLRINYTDSHLDEINSGMDDAFETLDQVMADALEIIEEYERKIED